MEGSTEEKTNDSGPKRVPTAETGLAKELKEHLALARSFSADTADMIVPEEFLQTEDDMVARGPQTDQCDLHRPDEFSSSTITITVSSKNSSFSDSRNGSDFNILDSSTVFGARTPKRTEGEQIQTQIMPKLARSSTLQISSSNSIPEANCNTIILNAIREARKKGSVSIAIKEDTAASIDIKRLIGCIRGAIEYHRAPSSPDSVADEYIDLQFFSGADKKLVNIVITSIPIEETQCPPS